MVNSLLSAERLQIILDTARLAPSVHNTQPWLIQTAGNKLLITIDKDHSLGDGDPTGRETIISLGIFAEAVCIGARAAGLRVSRTTFGGGTVQMTFEVGADPTKETDKILSLLHERSTDRSTYGPATITDDTIRSITATGTKSVSVHVTTDRAFVEEVADLTSRGIRLALSNPAFRLELSNYLTLPWSRSHRGIAVKSLRLPLPLALLEPRLVRAGVGLDSEAKLEKKRWLSASAIVTITADGDMPQYWFEVGRVYLRASLAIENAGLSQATSAAIVEASNYHEDIEKRLGTNQRILSVIRIGAGSPRKQHSPRLSTSELLATSNQ